MRCPAPGTKAPSAAPPNVSGASSGASGTSIASSLPLKVRMPAATAPPGTSWTLPSSTLRSASVSTAPSSRTLAIQARAASPPISPSMRRATSDSASGAGASRRPACSIIRQASNRLIPPPPESAERRMNGTSSASNSLQSAESKPTGSAARTRAEVASLAKKRSNISLMGRLSSGRLNCMGVLQAGGCWPAAHRLHRLIAAYAIRRIASLARLISAF